MPREGTELPSFSVVAWTQQGEDAAFIVSDPSVVIVLYQTGASCIAT